MRCEFWSHVYFGLADAEREGVYHGDLHGGNVLVRPFHVKIIDFGTSALAGKSRSLRRHARMVNEFAQWLLPEYTEYIVPLDIRKLSQPKFATFVVGDSRATRYGRTLKSATSHSLSRPHQDRETSRLESGTYSLR